MTKYILLWMALLLGQASAQTPFPFVPHQVLGADALNAAGGSKADATNGHLTTPVITGGTQAAPAITNPTILGSVAVSPTGSLSVVANVPLEGFYTTGGGPLVSMCPGYDFGCNTAINKIMAQTASVTTTLGDAGVQEAGINAYIVNKTGEALSWVASRGYTAGKNVISDFGQNLYVETVATCTSAASGGPTGTGAGIADGTCLWNYNGNPGLRGKMAVVGTTLVLPGGTQAWAGDFDTFIFTGWMEGFATGVEVDVTNNSGRDATGLGGGAPTIYDLYLGGSVGEDPITAYIDMSPFGLNGTKFMSHEGVFIQGQYTIKDHDFRVSTHSLAAFFDDANSVHGTASYIDSSTSPNGILLQGTYTTGTAFVANATIAAFQTSPGADFSGLVVTNAGTTANTTDANIILNTGNANSYARMDLFDSNSLNFQTGSAVAGGITIATLAGPINLNPATHLVIGGIAAVNCPAATVSLTTLVVSDGIVTHC